MAFLRAFAGFRLNGAGDWTGEITNYSSDSFTLGAGDREGTFHGAFEYDGFGGIYGRATSYEEKIGEVRLFRLSGLDMDAHQLAYDLDHLSGRELFAKALDGRDRIVGSSSDDSFGGFDGRDTMLGRRGSDHLYGHDGRDKLVGGPGIDRLVGGAGADVLKGGRGRDYLEGEDGADRAAGGAGRDDVRGGKGDDRLFGGRGADYLDGGWDDDVLKGGAGRDKLVGDSGDDRLKGGRGADTFFFAEGFGDDTITDFRSNDLIWLEGFVFLDTATDVIDDHVMQAGRDVIISLYSGSIELLNTDADALTEENFLV